MLVPSEHSYTDGSIRNTYGKEAFPLQIQRYAKHVRQIVCPTLEITSVLIMSSFKSIFMYFEKYVRNFIYFVNGFADKAMKTLKFT